MTVPARHSAPYRSQGRRDISAVGTAPLENRTHDGLARRLPHAQSPLRTQDGTLSRRHQHRLHSHLLPQARRMRRPHNECEGAPLRLGDRIAEAEVLEVVRAGDSGPGARWASGPHAADVRPRGGRITRCASPCPMRHWAERCCRLAPSHESGRGTSAVAGHTFVPGHIALLSCGRCFAPADPSALGRRRR